MDGLNLDRDVPSVPIKRPHVDERLCPTDLLQVIFGYLETNEIQAARCVHSTWKVPATRPFINFTTLHDLSMYAVNEVKCIALRISMRSPRGLRFDLTMFNNLERVFLLTQQEVTEIRMHKNVLINLYLGKGVPLTLRTATLLGPALQKVTCDALSKPVLNILLTQCPQLQRLDFYDMAFPDDLNIANHSVQCLALHRCKILDGGFIACLKKLHTLTLSGKYDLPTDVPVETRGQITTLNVTRQSLLVYERSSGRYEALKLTGFTALETLTLSFTENNHGAACNDLQRELEHTMPNLTNLLLENVEWTPRRVPLRVLGCTLSSCDHQCNFTAMKRLILWHATVVTGSLVKILAACTVLEELYLSDYQRYLSAYRGWKPFLRPNVLPRSLRKLALCDIELRYERHSDELPSSLTILEMNQTTFALMDPFSKACVSLIPNVYICSNEDSWSPQKTSCEWKNKFYE